MIHHELGCAYRIEPDGTKTTVDAKNPRDFAMESEEGKTGGDAMACARETILDWLAWIFEPGPHPCLIMPRLVACTTANAPWRLSGLPHRDAAAVNGLVCAAEIASYRVLLGGRPSPAKIRAHAEVVHLTLTAAYRREGKTWDAVPSASGIEAMLEREAKAPGEDTLIRAHTMDKWMARVWDAGPRLCEAMKALFIEARCFCPEMILNMSGAEISALFGQGRASESARVKKRVNEVLLRAGFRKTTFRFQKSLTACKTYAARAKGNRHRATSAAKHHAA